LLISQNLNRSHDHDHALWGMLCNPKLILHTANQCIKCEDPKFSRFRDILGNIKISNGSHNVTTPLSGTDGCPWAGTVQFNLHTKFKVSIFTHYDRKCRN